MSAYKIISAVIPERVDDSTSDRYLVVAPEDKIVWVATDEPQDLTPEGRKRAVHQAGLLSLLNRLKREENAVESEQTESGGADSKINTGSDFSYLTGTVSEESSDESEGEYLECEEPWEREKH